MGSVNQVVSFSLVVLLIYLNDLKDQHALFVSWLAVALTWIDQGILSVVAWVDGQLAGLLDCFGAFAVSSEDLL
jgi:hypothetical protein